MYLLKTQLFAIRNQPSGDETRVSGVIRAEWQENGQDRAATYAYESAPEYSAAVLDAMALIVSNRKLLD